MAEHQVAFEGMAWETPAPHVREKRIVRRGKALRLLELERGFVEEDWCLREHAGYVIEGRLTVAFGDEAVEFGPGDGIDISPGEGSRHKATPLSERVLLFLVDPA